MSQDRRPKRPRGERKDPILTRGGLTGRIYIVTSYTEKAGGMIVASRKYDVTERFAELAAEIAAEEKEEQDAQDRDGV